MAASGSVCTCSKGSHEEPRLQRMKSASRIEGVLVGETNSELYAHQYPGQRFKIRFIVTDLGIVPCKGRSKDNHCCLRTRYQTQGMKPVAVVLRKRK